MPAIGHMWCAWPWSGGCWMNKMPSSRDASLEREVRVMTWGLALIFVGTYFYNVFTAEPPYAAGQLGIYALFSLALVGVYVLFGRYWERIFRSSKLEWGLLILLAAGLLVGIAIASRGRADLYFYLVGFDGYAGLLYFTGKRRWSIVLIAAMMMINVFTYALLWTPERAISKLAEQLPWYGLGAVTIEFVMRHWMQSEKMETLALQLTQANQKLQDYTARAEELAVTRERNRLAREIHDTLGHTLTALDIQTELLSRLPVSQGEKRRQATEQARKLVKSGLSDVRRAVKALHPSRLESLSLSEAITEMVNEFENLTRIKTRWEIRGEMRSLPARYTLPLYRAAQESLTNIQRHASDTPQVDVILDYSPTTVTLSVENAPAPMPAQAMSGEKEGFGLRGLRERAEALGGNLQAGPFEGGGFRVEMRLPIPIGE